jgi:hypothetical protein
LGYENHVRSFSNRPDHDFGIVAQTHAFVITGEVDGNRVVARTLKERQDPMPVPSHPASAWDQDERCGHSLFLASMLIFKR